MYQKLYYQLRKQTHRVIRVTVTTQEYQEFKHYAKRTDETLPKLLQRLANSALCDIKELSPESRKVIADIGYQINAIGNNANQLAHAANIEVLKELPINPSEGARQLHAIHKQLVHLETFIKKKL